MNISNLILNLVFNDVLLIEILSKSKLVINFNNILRAKDLNNIFINILFNNLRIVIKDNNLLIANDDNKKLIKNLDSLLNSFLISLNALYLKI